MLDTHKVSQAVNRIRLAGFTLVLIERYLFRVEPVDQLTEAQKQFLVAHQPDVAEFLYSENQNVRRTNQR